MLAVLAGHAAAQTAPMRIGPGVTAPRVIRKVEPEFSPLARANQIQGTVVLQLVVSEIGRATQIQVISPLGYGLDENAIAAIQEWEFAPGQKDGNAVPILATIEVAYRFVGSGFDEGYERRRTQFNVALQALQKDSGPAKARAIESMLKLSKQNFPAAVYLIGLWETTGENAPAVAKDPVAGSMKFAQAAKKNYGPAIYQIALRTLAGQTVDEKRWDQMRQAATLGSLEAQFLLGDRHQRGDGVEQSVDRAKNYFRLCAARGVPQCQYRLARLMFDAPNRPDYEYEQSLAWFGLAADKGNAEARQVVEQELANLTAAQARAVATLKRQFGGQFGQ